jgi:hypothetical protein
VAFPNPINKSFVASLSETVKFEFDSALEYVSVRHDEPQKASNAAVGSSPPVDRNPYQGVFEWLRSPMKVKKIFKVIVEDLGPYPHTDEAIKAALEEFEVEKWDWRKFDICSKTILKAAKETRELYLQSSGNEAILRSWSCKHGLAELTKVTTRAST